LKTIKPSRLIDNTNTNSIGRVKLDSDSVSLAYRLLDEGKAISFVIGNSDTNSNSN